jgi:hypothetical protein
MEVRLERQHNLVRKQLTLHAVGKVLGGSAGHIIVAKCATDVVNYELVRNRMSMTEEIYPDGPADMPADWLNLWRRKRKRVPYEHA